MSNQYSQYSSTSNAAGGGQPSPGNKTYRKGLGFTPSSLGKFSSDPVTTMLREAPSTPMGQCALTSPELFLINAGATIPLFNLEAIAESKDEERKRLVEEFGNALTEVGFIGFNAENLSPLIQAVYSEMGKYFRRPFESKLADWSRGESQEGFTYRGCEIGPKAERPDYKESYFIPHNFTRWPHGLDMFPKAMAEFHNTMTLYAQFLHSLLMEYLAQPMEDAEHTVLKANNLLRLAYFPMIKPGEEPKGIWAAPQRDRNVLTLITPGTIPGLQFYGPSGQWQPVIVPEGHLILNTGLLLQHKTAGLIKARWHRVVNPGGRFTRLERFSTAFYATWPDDYPLKPFDNCVKTATQGLPQYKKRLLLRRYQDMTVKEKTDANLLITG